MVMRTRRRAFAYAPEAPISSLNTTPLIDVMLVLLIMFIVTIPLMSHSVKIDLPTEPPAGTPLPPRIQRLEMDAGGRLAWNGTQITEASLEARLVDFRETRPDGVLHFRTDGQARYEDFDRVLAIVRRARIDQLAFLGNESFVRAIER
jgi:biopolymer transport protein ExbD